VTQPHTRLAVVGSLAIGACLVTTAAQTTSEIDALMQHVGERVAEYHRRAQHVIGVERATVQPIRSNWTPEGFARTVESELRLVAEVADGETPPEPKVIRDVRRINGRAPHDRDRTDRSGCTDPTLQSPEPLAFLLPARRDEYRFTSVRNGREKDRAAIIIDFMSANRKSKPELIEDERGHADCFDWSGPIATRGRVWVDANTHEVLRVDRRLEGPVDVRVPWTLQRRYRFEPWVVIERDDLTMRYRPVAFSDPDEVILLPESFESLTVVRAGLQSTRRTETFTDYRRFLTRGRVVKEP
jgi:hypothetical protein